MPSDEARQYLAAIVESSDDAIVAKDLNGVVTSWNAGAERLFGYTAQEMVGRPILLLIPDDRRHEEDRILERLRAGEMVHHYETLRRRKDGTLVDVSLTVSPIRNRKGAVIGASKIARDITERRQLAEQQKLILGEMQHRTKNLAAVIDALARQSKPRGNPAVDAFIESFTARLRALLSTGELVVGSPSRKAELRKIFETITERFFDPHDPSRILLSGPVIEVSEQTAGSLGLAVHELATNALKYGALSSNAGRISLEWSEKQEGPASRVLVEWKETGARILGQPDRKGFGSLVIASAVAQETDGHVDLRFEPDGVRCRFAFLYSG